MDFLALKSTRATDSNSKFKTEICRNWTQGLCEFGNKCMFAHGHLELRNKDNLAGYKTKKCKLFHEQGFCQYGSRCQFKHFDKTENLKSEILSTAPSSSREESPVGRKRLPIFVKLSGKE